MVVPFGLSFYYSTMVGGKSAYLTELFLNIRKKGLNAFVFNHIYDNRYGIGVVASRLGCRLKAIKLHNNFDIFNYSKKKTKLFLNTYFFLVDEVQFLKIKHIRQMIAAVNIYGVNVLCFGLRSDFLGEPFPASSYLLATADHLIFLPAFCYCGKMASFNMRINTKGEKVLKGAVIMIGGEGLYIQVCRRHYVIRKAA
jgi:thymidine kinase